MKKTTKKVIIASIFACALAAVSIGASNVNVVSASTVSTDDGTHISMVDGAALRLENEELGTGFGMRFKTQIDKAWYDTLENPQVYTILLPTDMLAAELTADTANIAKADIDESKKYAVDDNYRFNAVLTKIPEADYSREISVRSYITADNLAAPLYSPLATGAYDSIARTVVDVASKAVVDNADKFAAVEKYLITGVSTERYLEVGSSSSAKLSFAEGTSAAAQEILNEKYPLTVTGNDNENVVSVAEDGTLTANTTGTANITVKNEELGFNATVTVNAYQRAYGTLVDFNHLDTSDYVVTEQASEVNVAEYNDVPAIKISTSGEVTEASTDKLLFMANSPLALPEWYDNFDTVTVTAAWVADVETKQQAYIYNESALQCKSGETITVTMDREALKNKIAKNGAIRMYAQYRYAMSNELGNYDIPSSLYIMGLELGINDIESAGETVNLYDKFHNDDIASFTFKPMVGEATTIENPEAFVAKQDGVITATIRADGYAEGTVTANYDLLTSYGTVVDFTNIIEADQLNPQNEAEYDVIPLDNGQQVIAFTLENTVKQGNGGVRIKIPDEYFSDNVCLFTTFSFTCRLALEEQSSTDTTNWRLNNSGNAVDTLKNTGDEVTFTGTIEEHKVSGNYIKCYVVLKHPNVATKGTFYITDVTLGFADLAVGDTFSWANYGIDVSELSAVSFDGTPVDPSAFTTETAGTLTFTVNKAGYAPTTFSINVV